MIPTHYASRAVDRAGLWGPWLGAALIEFQLHALAGGQFRTGVQLFRAHLPPEWGDIGAVHEEALLDVHAHSRDYARTVAAQELLRIVSEGTPDDRIRALRELREWRP